MNLQKKKVFVPISIEDEEPKSIPNTGVFSTDKWGCNKIVAHNKMFFITHWLKEQELYCFSADELKVVLSTAFEAGADRREAYYADRTYGVPTNDEYINSLDIK